MFALALRPVALLGQYLAARDAADVNIRLCSREATDFNRPELFSATVLSIACESDIATRRRQATLVSANALGICQLTQNGRTLVTEVGTFDDCHNAFYGGSTTNALCIKNAATLQDGPATLTCDGPGLSGRNELAGAVDFDITINHRPLIPPNLG